MNPQFVQLFPYVLTGILLGTLIPFGNNAPPENRRRALLFPAAGDEARALPPGVDNNTRNHSRLYGLLVRCMASIQDAIGAFYALSTTLQRGDSQAPHVSTGTADPRNKLLSATQALGWTGLAGVSADGLSNIGTLRGPEGSLTTQDEQSYVRRYISYTLVDVLSRRDDAVLSPGVLNDLARNFARTGRAPSLPSLAGNLHLDDDDIAFVLRSMVEIASLVIALISRIENEADIRAAFRHFAEDPTAWARYSTPPCSADLPSIERIVQQTHRSRGPSFRNLTVGPPRFPSRAGATGKAALSFSVTLAPFNGNPTFTYGGGPIPDAEAGTETVALRDEEVEYLAALFVVALMQFHARGAASALSFKRAGF
ncbi:hypothetical protein D9756_008921 [Leucocoprinus leucothites]|uniref:Uncharacterized protein n=1 Tax=Leucocoprinus leucothites TaxID=201217 RepID=A0A8H5CX96_9AGAR|nr:hypothetical protein D9756_008921 [Leucoagaricus leucothites]